MVINFVGCWHFEDWMRLLSIDLNLVLQLKSFMGRWKIIIFKVVWWSCRGWSIILHRIIKRNHISNGSVHYIVLIIQFTVGVILISYEIMGRCYWWTKQLLLLKVVNVLLFDSTYCSWIFQSTATSPTYWLKVLLIIESTAR